MSGWEWAKRAALRTVGKKPVKPMPTREQKLAWLIGEHSQIKIVNYWLDLDDLRQWVGVHFLRHPFTYPFICSQRSDRQDNPEAIADAVLSFIREDIVNDPEFDRSQWRDWRLQGSRNNHTFVLNAQTFINISRKRLCRAASNETREVWQLVHEAMKEIDSEIAAVMVPNCVYRGFCPETECCGFVLSRKYEQDVAAYRSLILPPERRLRSK